MSKKSTQKTEPWKPGQQYILGAAKNVQGAYDQSQPAIQANTAAVNSVVPQLLERFQNPSALQTNAKGYLSDVLGGKYLGGNPHIQQIVDQTREGVGNDVNSIFSKAGRTGGSDHHGMLTTKLADAENRLRYQNYGDERSAMTQAAGLAPGIENMDLAGLEAMFSAANMGSMLPMQAAAAQSGALGNLLSPYTQTTQKQSELHTIGNMLGLAAMAFGGGAGGGGGSGLGSMVGAFGGGRT